MLRTASGGRWKRSSPHRYARSAFGGEAREDVVRVETGELLDRNIMIELALEDGRVVRTHSEGHERSYVTENGSLERFTHLREVLVRER